MIRRLLLASVLAFVPLVALADDAAPTPTPATAQGSSSADGLLGPDQTANSGSTTADGGTLQPAGVNPLQSSNSSSTGLTAPTDPLQGAAASDSQLSVLGGEADGSTHSASSQSRWRQRVVVVSLVLIALGVAAEVMRRRSLAR